MPDFRRATPRDIAAVHALVESAYRGDSARRGWTHEADLLGGQRTDAQEIAALIADPAHYLMLMGDGAALVGCADIADRGGGLAYLGMLSIAPGRQAGGLGKALIAAAERVAAQHFHARTVEMTVIRQRTELIAYYARRGYALTGETRPFPYGDARFGDPRRDDLDFVVLAKPLTSPAV
ncbi:GNAT family N-acetyltransferase [Sphingomonas sp.]|uniref:GNAT family N-acetyltransferase n=1 Tax=Sphingomonas sp. TaxID=28214 RepID=UPI001DA45159|nr:GNAT family N-acetyltransferase [Sphingomonas sp.]MBX9795759.1 GNAT family N-acetyltransferase [Sphingomonas sp.]